MIAQLEDLLEAAARAVALADYAGAAALVPQIEAALAQLGPQADARTLARLRRQAERNVVCLDAARRGLRAARRRMEEVRRSAQGLSTYDDKGKRHDLPHAGLVAGRF